MAVSKGMQPGPKGRSSPHRELKFLTEFDWIPRVNAPESREGKLPVASSTGAETGTVSLKSYSIGQASKQHRFTKRRLDIISHLVEWNVKKYQAII